MPQESIHGIRDLRKDLRLILWKWRFGIFNDKLLHILRAKRVMLLTLGSQTKPSQFEKAIFTDRIS